MSSIEIPKPVKNPSAIIREIDKLIKNGASFEEVAALVDDLPPQDQSSVGSMVAYHYAQGATKETPTTE